MFLVIAKWDFMLGAKFIAIILLIYLPKKHKNIITSYYINSVI